MSTGRDRERRRHGAAASLQGSYDALLSSDFSGLTIVGSAGSSIGAVSTLALTPRVTLRGSPLPARSRGSMLSASRAVASPAFSRVSVAATAGTRGGVNLS